MRNPALLAVVAAAGLAAAACSESSPVASGEKAVVLGRFTCFSSVVTLRTTCAPSDPNLSSGARTTAVILSQDSAYAVASSGDVYDEATETYSFDMKVRNMRSSPIGTDDGTTLHSDGIRVFFSSGPTVWLGTGIVTVSNADGTDAFTASNQPYFQYNQILTQYQYSNAKNWQFHVPTTVQGWYYNVLVWAHVP
ncbi:MAG TPA: hypothetical protein VF771_17160 [Longimicrobiaceae bacterium]